MLKPKSYSIQEIHNAAYVSLEATFYTNKEETFIIKELERACSKCVQITNRKDIKPMCSSIIIVKEYEAKKPLYTIKTAFYDYPTFIPILESIAKWISEQTTTDYSTHMKLGLSFNSHILETISNISNMNPKKLVLRINENLIYDKFPLFKNSPWGISIKKISLLSNYINSDNILESFSSNAISILDGSKYSIDFTKYQYGILYFNYIGGKNYANNLENIKDVCEYLINETYSVLNSDGYNNYEIETLNKLTESYRKHKDFYDNPEKFIKECKDIKLFVDLHNDIQLIKTYWNYFKQPLFKLINECNFTKGLFNYDTETGKCQVKDAKLTDVNISGYELFNIEANGVFENCDLYRCKINKGNFKNCNLHFSNVVVESYIENSNIGSGNLTKCFIRNNEEVIECDLNGCVVIYGIINSRTKLHENNVIIEHPQAGMVKQRIEKTKSETSKISFGDNNKCGAKWIKDLDTKLNKNKIKYN